MIDSLLLAAILVGVPAAVLLLAGLLIERSKSPIWDDPWEYQEGVDDYEDRW